MIDRRGANLRLHRTGRLSRRRRWGRGLSRKVAWLSAAFGTIERGQPDASASLAAADEAAILRALVAESTAAAPDRPVPAIGSATFMGEPSTARRALAIDSDTADAIEQRLVADSRSAAPDRAAVRAALPQPDPLAAYGDAIDDRTLADLVFTPPLG